MGKHTISEVGHIVDPLVLLTYVSRVQYSCGIVLVFWFWREIVFGITYVLNSLTAKSVLAGEKLIVTYSIST
jgi:hypothetical protein